MSFPPAAAPMSGSYAARSAQAHQSNDVVPDQFSSQPPPPPPPQNQFAAGRTAPMPPASMPSQPPPMPQQQQQFYTPQPQPQQNYEYQPQLQPPQNYQYQQPPASIPPSYNAHGFANNEFQETQILNEAMQRMQQSTHIMRGAMEANDLSTTLDRAAAMLGELGDPKHHHHHHHHHQGDNRPVSEPKPVMSPKHYYELYMMALEELPNLEEYFLSLTTTDDAMGNIAPPGTVPPPSPYTMKDLYEIVQYCPRAVPRLYLQICAGSALIRSGGDTVKNVLQDLKEGVKCVQCPIRGLFLRHYLLQAVKDKLPDEKEVDDDVQVAQSTEHGDNGTNAVNGLDHGDATAGVRQESHVELNVHEHAIVDNLQEVQVPGVHKASHNDALDDLMGGMDGGGDHDMFAPEANVHQKKNADDGASAKNQAHLEDLMGGLGVDVHDDGSAGFLEEVPVSMPTVPPPAPPAVSVTVPPIPPPQPTPSSPPKGMQQDDPSSSGTVQDSYRFVLSNFIEMNKLWVRIQHMPGDSKTRETKRKRERERNELRMMVGTNLVRLSELEGVTSAIYGTVILPKILDQIVACHDPLAQAYLMDCIIQVFPDEFHIQTLEIVLSVCPKLREKVNIRTIMQSIMDRLSKYYADELLLNDEEDTEGVKMSVMLDSFQMFDDCIRAVINARGMKLTAREAIRLESSLVDFSLKCYPGRMDHIDGCLGDCTRALRGEMASGTLNDHNGGIITSQPVPIQLDNAAIGELEKMLSLPLEELALSVLNLEHYSQLLALLPWNNRKKVAVTMLSVVDSSGEDMMEFSQMDQLFSIISPLLQKGESPGVTVTPEEEAVVAKIIHVIYNEDTDVHFEMLSAAKRHISGNGDKSVHLVPLFYSTLKLLDRIQALEYPASDSESVSEEEDSENESDASDQDLIGMNDVTRDEEETNGDDQDLIGMKDVARDTNEDGGEQDLIGMKDISVAVLDSRKLDVKDFEPAALNGEDDEGGGDKDDGENTKEKDGGEQDSTQQELLIDIDEPVKNEGEVIAQNSGQSTEDDLFADTPFQVESATVLPPFTKQITCRKIFLFIQQILSSLRDENAEQCLNLSLHAAAAALSCAETSVERGGKSSDFTPIATEFFSGAFLAYESGTSDPNAQRNAITSMIGTLTTCKAFDKVEYGALITKVAQFAARLAKKADQCKMVMLCSHLFYCTDENGYKNPQRVLECLQRSLKVADSCVASSPENVQLFVDILDCYLYHYEKQNPFVTDRYISGLIALVTEHINTIEMNSAVQEAKSQFIQTVRYIEQKKNDSKSFSRFAKIVCKLPN